MAFGLNETNSKVRQSTINANVGIQGNQSVGVTGNLGKNATMASVGGVAIAPIQLKSSKNKGPVTNTVTINTTTTDKDAFATIGQIASGQASIATQAINASHQIAINSLLSSQAANETAARLAEMSVGGAIEVAGMAAPVSEGNLTLASNKKQIVIGIAILIAIVVIVKYRKKILT